MEPLLIFGLFLVLVLVWLFLWAIPVALWISALAARVRISLFTLVGMRLRRVPPPLIVNQLIAATKAGLTLNTDALEAHFLAGGNVSSVVNALIAADKASIDLSFERAAAIDLANSTDGLTAAAASLAVLTDAFVLTSAVIETVTSQTALVIPATADAVADDAYHGAIAVLIDADDANNKSFQVIEGYTASTRTVTLGRAPTFTVTTADTITILATTDAGGVC